ncbi:MAG: hypothetical protein MI919_24980 [Holophagales bacterium]|nr:hypothetical protein [Holophagales bacterium]
MIHRRAHLLVVFALLGLLVSCSGAPPGEVPRSTSGEPGTAARSDPGLDTEGFLFFSPSDIEHARRVIEEQTFPISEAELCRKLGFSLRDLRRGFAVTAGGGVARTFLLSPRCYLRLGSDLWDESDSLTSAEVLCHEDESGFPPPEPATPFADRESALRSLSLGEQQLQALPRCQDGLADAAPVSVDCRHLDEAHDLLLRTTERGVFVATRPREE